MQEGDVSPTHAWCDLDLNKPSSAGPWAIGGEWNYVTAHYMLDIPADWAEANAPGMRLGTGRFREGGQGSLGPALFAIGPWNEGNPPPANAKLRTICLLKYSQITDETRHTMKDYHHADDWTGAAWLTCGDRSAVVFAGTKGWANAGMDSPTASSGRMSRPTHRSRRRPTTTAAGGPPVSRAGSSSTTRPIWRLSRKAGSSRTSRSPTPR
jgi:hypothetical protein